MSGKKKKVHLLTKKESKDQNSLIKGGKLRRGEEQYVDPGRGGKKETQIWVPTLTVGRGEKRTME